MKAAGISDLKKELKALQPKDLVELCLRLAKYKKDNKELIGFLLFEAHDKPAFVESLKLEIKENIGLIDKGSNLYYVKKSLRKILRQIVKYCKYLDDKALAADLHIYFCLQLKQSGIPYKKSQLLLNMYEQELKKIHLLIATLHEDLQADYHNDLEAIEA